MAWTAWRHERDGVEAGPGARMIDHANRLAGMCSGSIAGPQQQLACGELRRAADDIVLQSRIVATLGDGVVRQD